VALTIGILCLGGAALESFIVDPQSNAQRQIPGTASGESRTAAISGQVVAASSGQPIAEATANLYSDGPGGPSTVATDTEGRFVFPSLPAGHYIVAASKSGFVGVRYGESRPGGSGRPVNLAQGERRDIRIQLPRPSQITGRITDDQGRAAANAKVKVLRLSFTSTYRRPMSVTSAITDNRGFYRIPALDPGDYVVCASTTETAPLNAAQRLQVEIDRLRASLKLTSGSDARVELTKQLAALEARLPASVDPVYGYPHICHPGTGARPDLVSVSVDEELSGIDLRFRLTRLARIEGMAVGSPGLDLDSVSLVSADDLQEEPIAGVRQDQPGPFQFTNVPPGRYRVFLLGGGSERTPDGRAPVRVRAAADVTIVDQDVTGVVLQTQREATLAGHVEFRNIGPEPAATGVELLISMESTVPWPLSRFSGSSMVSVDGNGRFVLPHVFPGDYRLRVSVRQPDRWFEDGTALAGKDVRDSIVSVLPDQHVTNLDVTLTNNRATLSGMLLDEQGQPAPQYLVVLYSAGDRKIIRMARPKLDGRYVMEGLIGGQYRLAPALDPQTWAWMYPGFLDRLDPISIPVSIGNGESKMLEPLVAHP
jgi:hypothetical protein